MRSTKTLSLCTITRIASNHARIVKGLRERPPVMVHDTARSQAESGYLGLHRGVRASERHWNSPT